MQLNLSLYAVLDNLTGQYSEFTIAPNAGVAARNILLTLRVPLKDTQLVCLGNITSDYPNDCQSITHDYVKFQSVDTVYDWSVYRFPENIAEAISPLGCTPDEVREISLNHVRNLSNNRSELQDKVNNIYNNKEGE